MRAYIIRRLLLIISTLFIVSLIVFLTIRLIPGDVVDLMVSEGEYITEIDKASIEQALGLDVPILTQYGRWIGDIIMHGDLGTSLWRQTSVTTEVVDRIPVTFELSLMAMVIGLIIAMPIGVYSALRQDTWSDYIWRSFAILCIAVPGFWLGTMKAGLTIGELAGELQLNPSTIRYYEEVGLLPEPRRSESGYRLYSPYEIERLRLVKRAKLLGLSLVEIKEIVQYAIDRRCDLVEDRLLSFVEAKLGEIDQKIDDLVAFRDNLWQYHSELHQLGRHALSV